MKGSSAEREQGSSSGTSPVSNRTAGNRCEEAPSDGLVNGQMPFSMKRRRHINNERQRRVHMNTLLDSLQELLHVSNPRKDQYSLLTDTVNYLRSLEDKAQELATRKEMIMAYLTQTKKIAKPSKVATLAMSSHLDCLQNVNVQVFKSLKPTTELKDIIITFTSLQMKGIFLQILMLFSINQIEIVTATFSITPDDQMLHFIHVQVPKDLNLQIDNVKALLSSHINLL